MVKAKRQRSSEKRQQEVWRLLEEIETQRGQISNSFNGIKGKPQQSTFVEMEWEGIIRLFLFIICPT